MKMEPEQLWPGGPLFVQDDQIRLTTDTVLLADFARTSAGGRGADLGCASGALMLLLLWESPSIMMTGLELSEHAAALAEENMERNGFAEKALIVPGDLRETAKRFQSGSFDFVISNPPYFEPERCLQSPQAERAAARAELSCSLEDICAAAARLCRSGGRVFLCYRPEGLNRLMQTMTRHRLEPKRMRLVHHRPGKEAMLVLVEGRKDGNPGLRAGAPLILYAEKGQETDEYRRIYHRDTPG
ncbi:MAG: methyltransferase [Oscillospiraceae bacterium]|nr:methyltransferase [Oscillospiraceae bacterium]